MSWILPWSKSTKKEAESSVQSDVSLSVPDDTLGLNTLYQPADLNIDIDVVAVHGLGGDAYSTWTEKTTQCLWLRDLLPQNKAFQKARIMTFGYDARSFTRPFQESTTDRTFTFAEALLFDISNARSSPEVRNRPLIFVGHSLGGNVIKSALVRANNQQTVYSDILNSTRCLVFFGTPHQGSDTAIWATYLGNLAQGLGIKSTTVTQELRRWSVPLVELQVNFAQLAPRFLIRSFFEMRPKHGVMIVHEGSARMFQANDKAVGLNADHLQICKFENEKNANARRVLQTFEALAGLMKAQPEVGTLLQPLMTMCPPLTEATDDPTQLQERLERLRTDRM